MPRLYDTRLCFTLDKQVQATLVNCGAEVKGQKKAPSELEKRLSSGFSLAPLQTSAYASEPDAPTSIMQGAVKRCDNCNMWCFFVKHVLHT